MYKENGDYYGLWFGNEQDRARLCQMIVAKANDASDPSKGNSAVVSTISYANKVGRGNGPTEASSSLADANVLHSLLVGAQAKATEPMEQPSLEKSTQKKKRKGKKGVTIAPTSDSTIHSPSTASGSTPTVGEQSHLANLLTNAMFKSSPTLTGQNAGPAVVEDVVETLDVHEQEGGRLSALLSKAALNRDTDTTSGSEVSRAPHVHHGQPSSPSTSTQPHQEQHQEGHSTRRPSQSSMLHMFVPPSAVVKAATAGIASSTTPPAPLLVDRLRAHWKEQEHAVQHHQHPHQHGFQHPPRQHPHVIGVEERSTSAAPYAAANGKHALTIGGVITSQLEELVTLQVARSSAKGRAPAAVSKDQLRQLLIHMLSVRMVYEAFAFGVH